MKAEDMFEKLDYNYEFIKGNCSEDVIHYSKDKKHMYFNTISKSVVLQCEDSELYYGKPTFYLTYEELQAINQQMKEIGDRE